ncbi:Crp/Fnr family transcriptional regulator [Aurantibacter sp.]|uniref:Crp/Fnr family transcriptional regulator n=1 Tax=Aurantibacter sp. TaxID=2807103 RepID=UPI003264BD03
MTNVLAAQLNQITKLSEEEILSIEESFPMKTFEKGTFLLKPGKIAKDSYVVIEGCIRKYLLEDGEEHTLDFYIEGDSAADMHSLSSKKPSAYFFVCSEKTTVAVLNAEKEAALYKKYPRFETICRVEFEKMMGEKIAGIERFNALNPENKYLDLLANKPSLINRVPQYQLASYLGIKPETLSRIRKRITEK